MKYKQLDEILKSDNKDLVDKIFEKDGFSFNENKIIDQLDNYKGCTADEIAEIFEYAKKFGLGIRLSDNSFMLPAGLCFKINRSNKNDSDTALFYIERNGAELPISFIEDNEEINVTFTEFGQKLYTYANETHTTIYNAYEQLKFIEKIFGVKIIKD